MLKKIQGIQRNLSGLCRARQETCYQDDIFHGRSMAIRSGLILHVLQQFCRHRVNVVDWPEVQIWLLLKIRLCLHNNNVAKNGNNFPLRFEKVSRLHNVFKIIYIIYKYPQKCQKMLYCVCRPVFGAVILLVNSTVRKVMTYHWLLDPHVYISFVSAFDCNVK